MPSLFLRAEAQQEALSAAPLFGAMTQGRGQSLQLCRPLDRVAADGADPAVRPHREPVAAVAIAARQLAEPFGLIEAAVPARVAQAVVRAAG